MVLIHMNTLRVAAVVVCIIFVFRNQVILQKRYKL
jgi:hypothetical protein